MNQSSSSTEKELAVLQRRFLRLSLLFIAGLFLLTLVSGFLYGEELQKASQWIYENFGFWTMVFIVYVSDTLLSPIPPDLFLVVIAHSDLKNQSTLYLAILSVASTLAGITGWGLGRTLYRYSWLPDSLRKFPDKHRDVVKKFGGWAVAIGALTPFPFSLTCWSAGLMHMPFKIFALGAVMRFPRIYIYYWAIESALWVPSTFSTSP